MVSTKNILLALGLGIASAVPAAVAASDDAVVPAAATQRPVPRPSQFRAERSTLASRHLLLSAWGVDNLKVHYTNAGNLIRFTYRVVEPAQAKLLTDKASTPYMVGLKSRVVLQVPVMDKIGQLRQTNALTAGQEYWMVFSNKGNLVHPGDRVDVVIGSFHAESLMVE